LGGRDNIVDVDACMTRLRVTVKENADVAQELEWKKLGAMGLIVKDKGVQAVYGPKADVLKSDIQDLLDSGVALPAYTSDNSMQREKTELLSVATGDVIAIEKVNDSVFAVKKMGDGFAVELRDTLDYSPVS